MGYFLFRLIPPRSTFPADITPLEGQLMQEHVVYWRDKMNQGLVIVFGPVADPKGTYGLGIIQVEDEDNPDALCANDPVVLANAGFTYEVHPMPQLVVAQH